MTTATIRSACAALMLGAFALQGCATSPEFDTAAYEANDKIVSNASDTSIHLAIQRDMGREFPRYFAEMATEVQEGRVLVVGTIRTPEDRVRASRVIWQIEGVTEVVNELQVAEEQSFYAYMKDARISNQLRARLLTAVDVQESNFDFETVNSVVYILGVARDKSELEYVAELAATIAGVEKVVSHALLADDPRRRPVRASRRF